jgi:hypothetical protein
VVALPALTDPSYFAAAVFAPRGCLAAARLVRRSTRAGGVRLLGALFAAGLVLAPIYAGYVSVRRANPDLAAQTFWRSTRLPHYLPHDLHQPRLPTQISLVALGFVVLGAAVGGRRAVRTASWLHGGLWAGVGFVLALGDSVAWYGRLVPTPMSLVDAVVPLSSMLRDPTRLGVGGLVGLAILGGLGAATCAARLGRTGRIALAAAIVAAMYLEYLGRPVPEGKPPLREPYPLLAAPALAPAVRDALAAAPGPLAEFPSGRQSPLIHAQAMYRSTLHWHPILGGYSSYWPAGFPERMALVDTLPYPDSLRRLRAETGLRWVLVHFEVLGPNRRAHWTGLDRETGGPRLRLVATTDTHWLYEVVDGAP